MKKALPLLFVLFLFTLSCTENVRIEPTGSVKSIRTISYQALEEKGEIKRLRKKGEFDYDDLDTYVEFDTSGNEILNIGYDSEGNLTRRFVTTFDHNGNEKRKIWYDSQGKIFLNHVSEFDETKNLTITRSFDSSNALKEIKEKITDDSGNVLVFKSFDENGSAIFNITNEYNKDGQLLTETTKWFIEPTMPDQITTYKYNSHGDQIEKKSKNDRIILHDFLKYNEYGDPVEILTYISMDLEDEKLISKDINSYKYDLNGNWINCIKFHNDTATFIIDREISYFE